MVEPLDDDLEVERPVVGEVSEKDWVTGFDTDVGWILDVSEMTKVGLVVISKGNRVEAISS